MKNGFDISAKLIRNGNDNILTPFKIKDFQEYASGKTNNQSHISFEISIRGDDVDSLYASVQGKSGTIYKKQLPRTMHKAGTHKWEWDGFDKNGIYSSKRLKGELTIEFIAIKIGGAKKSKKIKLTSRALEQDWLDITVNKNSKSVTVDFHLEFRDGGAQGIGESAPQEVQTNPVYGYSKIPSTHPATQVHTRTRSYADLKRLAQNGIKKYWSRSVNFTHGGTYFIQVNPVAAGKKVMDHLTLTYNTNRDWLRSSNPGRVRGIVSLFGNFAPQQIAYNIGWLYNKKRNRWFYNSQARADIEFSETSAHEVGHEILSAYGGETYSYQHKGTSTVTQKVKKVANGGEAYPATGDIDVMKYYDGSAPANYYSRLRATEKDVKSLLWLTRIKFETYSEESDYGD